MKTIEATRVRRSRAPAGLLVIALATLLVATPAAADVETVGGGAFGESVNLTVANATVTSGPIPAVTLPAGGGGPFSNSVLAANVPGVLQTGLVQVQTQGKTGNNGFAKSFAEIFGANVLNGTATAELIRSECTAGQRQPHGSTTLVGLTVLGIPVESEPPPNTTIPVPGVGTLIVNEQQKQAQKGFSSITVNAVHFILDDALGLGEGDIIIGQSRCQTEGSNVI